MWTNAEDGKAKIEPLSHFEGKNIFKKKKKEKKKWKQRRKNISKKLRELMSRKVGKQIVPERGSRGRLLSQRLIPE